MIFILCRFILVRMLVDPTGHQAETHPEWNTGSSMCSRSVKKPDTQEQTNKGTETTS